MKFWIILLVTLLLGTNAFWILSIIDDAVTCSYSDASFDTTLKMYNQTIVLANLDLKGKTAEQAISLIGKDVYGLSPFIKDGCVNVGQVCVQLNEDNVVIGFGDTAL
jgi:hypothetical protein